MKVWRRFKLKCGISRILFTLTVLLILIQCDKAAAWSASGCAKGSRNGFFEFENMAACAGRWYGHIENATNLCSPGWKVCSYLDHRLLQNISWESAIALDGCYALNAAHDGGNCRQCGNSLNQDDLGGVGKGCPHQNYGQTSCITGGRIDASCCVDSHFQKACQFTPGITTGVLCCKEPARKPKIIVHRDRIHVYTGFIFLLPCQAIGSPPPRTMWYKDGIQIYKNNTRLSVLPSGDLLVTLARKADSGLYSCEVINEHGIAMASSQVVVTDYASGCADGSTEGLQLHGNIHACKGKWNGHVRHARSLCKKGWKVCSPKDRHLIQDLTWLDIFDLRGCYAYNAANGRGKCRRCSKSKMAGVGRHCGRLRYSKSSCLANGRIDVFGIREQTSCNYTEGKTDGVLCCKRKRKNRRPNSRKKKPKKPKCNPPCSNGSKCVGHNRCQCAEGYKGAWCQNPICKPSCSQMARCIKPGVCKCRSGYAGKYCHRKLRCRSACLNGGKCHKGKCKCPNSHWGETCQYQLHQVILATLNRTER